MLSGVGDSLVQLGDFRFRFLPVIRKLLLACQPPLPRLELGQEILEWGQPVYGSAFRRRDELSYPPGRSPPLLLRRVVIVVAYPGLKSGACATRGVTGEIKLGI